MGSEYLVHQNITYYIASSEEYQGLALRHNIFHAKDIKNSIYSSVANAANYSHCPVDIVAKVRRT